MLRGSYCTLPDHLSGQPHLALEKFFFSPDRKLILGLSTKLIEGETIFSNASI